MDCPRCGAENDDARAACWNCFAQLHPSAGAKPLKIEPKKTRPARKRDTKPEPRQAPLAEEAAAGPPAEKPGEQPAPADSTVPDLEESAEETKAAAEYGYVVPGLAEPQPEAEEEISATEAAGQGEVEMEAAGTRVFDLNSIPTETAAPAPAAKAAPEAQPETVSAPIEETDGTPPQAVEEPVERGPKVFDLDEPVAESETEEAPGESETKLDS